MSVLEFKSALFRVVVKVTLDNESREGPWRHRTGGRGAGRTVHGADAGPPRALPPPGSRASLLAGPLHRPPAPASASRMSPPQHHYQRITELTVRSLVTATQTVPPWLCKLAGRGLPASALEDTEPARGLGGSPGPVVGRERGLQSVRTTGPVLLNRGKFCPPGDLWQCLETVLVFTACREEMVLVASGGQEPAIQLNGPRDKRFSGPETPTAPRPCCL